MLFAIKENYRADDPTASVKATKPPTRSQGHMTWGDAQIAAYRDRHPMGSTARLALELLLNVAARRGDAHKLGVQHIRMENFAGDRTRRSAARPRNYQFEFCPSCNAH
jgi:hypothetical protein